jgi:hypothetical protein
MQITPALQLQNMVELEDTYRRTVERREFERVMLADLADRFYVRVVSELARLRPLGVQCNQHVWMGSGVIQIADWFGVIGDLLVRGEVETAQQIGADREFWWSLTRYE